MRTKIKDLIQKGLKKKSLRISEDKFSVELTRDLRFGDYASNIGFFLKFDSSLLEELAAAIKKEDNENYLSAVQVQKGYFNFRLQDHFLINGLFQINEDFGKANFQKGRGVLLEFVSANPTGPLHIGHGRWAAIGDTLGNLLEMIGFNVQREYYINNCGTQIDRLVRSLKAKINNQTEPTDAYSGNFISETAELIKKKEGKNINDEKIRILSIEHFFKEQKNTLEKFFIKFDHWFFESNLHKKNGIFKVINILKTKGLTYEKDNSLWFKSTSFGDDKDRVLLRDNKEPTYFAADCAYHLDKIERGFDKLINIWGTDHHGYVLRLQAFFKALENDFKMPELKIIIGQLVSLFRGKEEVRMSKRTGDFVTLDEVIDEIGVDAARYFLVMRSADTHLDFDLQLAKEQSAENPVYYVQYAHARICSIFEKAKESNQSHLRSGTGLSKYQLNDYERDLILKVLSLPDEIEDAALNFAPHRLTNYAQNLATSFHRFYQQCRVLSDNTDERNLRIKIIEGAKIVLKNTLKILGVSAPEKM